MLSPILSPRKLLLGLGVGTLLVGSVFVGKAAADDPTPTPGGQKANLRDAFLSALAQNLGITTDKLKGAITQSENQTIDQAVKDGKLTQQQADKLKQALASGKGPSGFFEGRGFGGRGFEGRGTPAIRVEVHNLVVQALADLLKKQPADVTALMRSGKSLDQILNDNGLTQDQLRNEIVSVAQKQLDQAVANGKITREQEAQLLDRIKSAPLNFAGPGMRDATRMPRGFAFGHRDAWPRSNPTPAPTPSS